VLVPQPLQALVDVLDLLDDRLVAPLREPVPERRPMLAQALDLGVDVR
jgi:hypothetical protein